MKQEEIEKYIDWELVMKQPRCAGGHEDIMFNIFGKNVLVIAHWIEDDYQGSEAFAYQFPDNSVVLITDYFGSCSGCDAWEDSTDEDVKNLIREMVSSARLFNNIQEAITFCEQPLDAFDYPFNSCSNLVEILKSKLKLKSD